MDNLVSLIFEKGIVFAIATVATILVGYFIKKDRDSRDEEFREYKRVIKLNETNMTEAAVAIKSASNEAIRTIKLEAAAIVAQMESFKQLLSKELLGMKAHSSQIHERSESIKKSINDVIGRVILIEKNQQQYDVVFKKLIEKTKDKI